MLQMIYQKTPRYWIEILDTLKGNPFEYFTTYLQSLNISTDSALNYFTMDYSNAVSQYSTQAILDLFIKVSQVNATKYSKLVAVVQAEYNPIDNYNMTESYDDTRTPDLTATSTGTSSADGTVKNNQTRNTTDTPDGYQETNLRSVNVYDGTGMRDESQNVTTQSGTRTTSESFSGEADTTHSESTAESTTHQSGTEKIHHELNRKGNIGVTTSQQMLESEISLAEKMNIFKVIEKDIADEIFLKVW